MQPPKPLITDHPEVRAHLEKLRARRAGLYGLPRAPLAPEEAAPKKPVRKKRTVKKIITTIRLSPEVLTLFRATGPGWQTRMDEVLREAAVHGRFGGSEE